MLLDFTVENFRSIKGAETLSAVAQGRKSTTKDTEQKTTKRRVKSDEEIAPTFHVEGWDIDILPVIGIFGANASGKSNVLSALAFLLRFMVIGGSENYHKRNIFTPFKLDKSSTDNPTHFELRTVFEGTIYTYSLLLDSNQIYAEKLEYSLASTKKTRRLFSRSWNSKSKEYKWSNGKDFKGSHIQLEESLQNHETYFGLLMRLEIPVIKSFTKWVFFQPSTSNFDDKFLQFEQITLDFLFESPKILKRVETLLCRLDTGLSGVEVRKVNSNENTELYALHDSDYGTVKWRFAEESRGTRDLFLVAFSINMALETGSSIIFDELGSSVHSNLTREIIKLFQNPKTNPKNAQLIFSSHDSTLQRNNLLRRDQIWFTQKRLDQSTELYSLSDFKERNDLAIDKAYLDGRFGAIPFISDDEEPLSSGVGKSE
jgi:uncharacterized protein